MSALWKDQIVVWIVGFPVVLIAIVLEIRHRRRERQRRKEGMSE